MEDTKPTKVDTGFMFGVNSEHLTPDQANHVSRIGKDFCMEMALKYTNGQRRHGGNLFDMSEDELLSNAIFEAIDQVVYLFTLREKRHGIVR